MKYLFVIITLFLFACESDEILYSSASGKTTKILGHGGMGGGNIYPMNTYEAILNCVKLGADGTEVDIQLSEDGTLVAFHDEYLQDATNSFGRISNNNWIDIQNTYYNNTPYLEYSVVSLEQIFTYLPKQENYFFTFDCKLYFEDEDIDYKQRFATALGDLIVRFNLIGRCTIESKDKEFLELLKKQGFNKLLFIYPESFDDGFKIASEMGLRGITIANVEVTAEQVALAQQAGIEVAIWGINNESDNIDALNKSPNFIQTDEVKNMVSLMNGL